MESANPFIIELKEVILPADNIELDQYVLKHPDCSVYHLSAWRNAIAAAYHHRQLILVAKAGATVVGYLPLCLVETPLLGKKLISLPFADFCGALADSAEIVSQLLAAATGLLDKFQAKSLQIRTRLLDQNLTEASPVDASQSAQVKVRMCVPLVQDSTALLKSYKPKLRSQIKKAEKNGLNAHWRTDFAALELFYQIYIKNMHRLGSPVHRFAWFEALWLELSQQDAIYLSVVTLDDLPVAAGLVIIVNQQACIPWASTLAEFNHLAPNMLMYWEIQAKLADRGVQVFDMGRSTAGEGTFRFKAQWGAEPEALCWFSYASAQDEPLLMTNQSTGLLRNLAEKVWPQLPLLLATKLGARLRKYITL